MNFKVGCYLCDWAKPIGSLPLSMYEVIAAHKPEDTIAKVLLYLRKSGGAIAHPAPLVPTPMIMND